MDNKAPGYDAKTKGVRVTQHCKARVHSRFGGTYAKGVTQEQIEGEFFDPEHGGRTTLFADGQWAVLQYRTDKAAELTSDANRTQYRIDLEKLRKAKSKARQDAERARGTVEERLAEQKVNDQRQRAADKAAAKARAAVMAGS